MTSTSLWPLPRWLTLLSLSGFLLLSPLPAGAAEPGAASARPRALALLNYLHDLTKDDSSQLISGQNLGHGNHDPSTSFQENVVRLRRVSGRWPAIVSVDYGFDSVPSDLRTTTDLLALHADHGGIVMASMHPANPWRGTTADDRTSRSAADLLNPDTAAYGRWRRDLSRIADSLSQLRDHGTIVLWRPLHEMNGEWFWWGKRTAGQGFTPQEFISVWKDMFEFFTRERQLNNLLWVYSPAARVGPEIDSVLDYYPGASFVDVVALDWYDDQFDNLNKWDSYAELARLDKPMGLAEVGPLNRRDGSFDNLVLLNRLRQDYPKFGFFVFWHSWPGARVAIVDNRRSADLMTHVGVIDRDELPRFDLLPGH